MHEKEIMKRDDYDLVIKKGFKPFIKRPEVQKDFVKCLLETSKLDTKEWLKEMDVMPLAEAFIEPPVDMISFLRSFNKFLMDVVEIPDKVVTACEATEKELLRTLVPQFKGAKREGAMQMCLFGFSRIATNHISPKKFDLFWPHIKRISEYIIKNGFIVQYHIDNDYTDVLEYFTEFPKGKIMFHLDMTDIFKAKEILGDRACLMGNVPPQITGRGTPHDVEKYCKKQIEGCMEGGGYMLGSSCVLPDEIPAENLKAMKDCVMKYGFYKK
jgi:uroporphyrinogen-III decarboxylase